MEKVSGKTNEKYSTKVNKTPKLKSQSYPKLKTKTDKELLTLHGITTHIKIKLFRIQHSTTITFKSQHEIQIQPTETAKKSHQPNYVCPHPKCYFTCQKSILFQNHLKKHAINAKSLNFDKVINKLPNRDDNLKYRLRYKAKGSKNARKMKNPIWHRCPYRPRCEYKSLNPSFLQKHLTTVVHDEFQTFQCTVCSREFGTRPKLKRHVATHSQEKRYGCSFPDCTYKTNVSSDVKKHMTVHTGERNYQCLICKVRFSQISSLRAHEKRKHSKKDRTPSKVFECSECDYLAVNYGKLTRHMKIHSGEKKFKCDQCDHCSREASDLKAHQVVHTKETRYTCTYCEYKTNFMGSLKHHVRTHTGEKPYKCPHCKYRASVKASVIRHAKTRH